LAQRFFFADGLIAFVVKEKLDEGVVVEALNKWHNLIKKRS